VVDLQAIRGSRVHVDVDPLGGASVAYWEAIGERYGLNLVVVHHTIDPTLFTVTTSRPDARAPSLRTGTTRRS
jgi:phosphoglucomutase